MSLLATFVLAIGLCFDSLAASVSCGLQCGGMKTYKKTRFVLLLALCQGAMPMLGWLLGIGFARYVQALDHWVAFVLLALLGSKMIWEATSASHSGSKQPVLYNKLGTQCAVALGTSIDAMVVGVSFAMLNMAGGQALQASLIIGIVTMAVATCGIVLGRHIGLRAGRYAEIAGGVVLLAIGVKILIEHLLAT